MSTSKYAVKFDGVILPARFDSESEAHRWCREACFCDYTVETITETSTEPAQPTGYLKEIYREVGQAYPEACLERACSEVDALRLQLAEARRDGERLDWLETNSAYVQWESQDEDGEWCEAVVHAPVQLSGKYQIVGSGDTYREAIDDARARIAKMTDAARSGAQPPDGGTTAATKD